LLGAEGIGGDLLLKVVMLDVDVFGTFGGTFLSRYVKGAFVVNAKGYCLWQNNASGVTGRLIINSEADWGK
jgi:hypothetical protein